ncbi:MAG: DUF2130 domain-containing protein [Gammaproteobacteria bacterium]|nr:DUF2130 domain-containing protein [Gammaproteobacteria bacterium]MBU1979604.1 DUF2130 domain-containing protein [Gammaproteobacteria bacterium]
MMNKIIIAATEPIVCPKCDHHFTLDQGITRQTIERYETEFDEEFAAQRKALEEGLAKEAERKATRLFAEQIAKLQEQLSDSRKSERESKESITKAQVEAKEKAAQEFEQEKKALADELADKESKLKQFREQELDLRKQKKVLEEAQDNLQLEIQRQLDDERKKLVEEIGRKEGNRFALIEAEYKKKIEDAQKSNEDLRRKLEQGSQQLQGEVLELELEHTLIDAFRHDRIEEVKKGVRGADVLQTVCTPAGQVCGRIIWEAKRAENWSEGWLQKLKDDQQGADARIAVLVTTALPKGCQEPFFLRDGVWVVSPHLIRPVAEALRTLLLETHKVAMINTGREEKKELLYSYLTSENFARKIRTVVESFASMKSQLDAEKRAMQKQWGTREMQINRVTETMASFVGELQAIAQDGLPQLQNISQFELPGAE